MQARRAGRSSRARARRSARTLRVAGHAVRAALLEPAAPGRARSTRASWTSRPRPARSRLAARRCGPSSTSPAGRSILDGRRCTPNHRATFAWNGLDAYGRPVHGGARRGSALRYTATRQLRRCRSAAAPRGRRSRPRRRRIGAQRDAVDGAQYHPPQMLGTLASAGPTSRAARASAAGRSAVHHAYDPTAQVLHLGTRRAAQGEAGANVIGTVAGVTQAVRDPGLRRRRRSGQGRARLRDQRPGRRPRRRASTSPTRYSHRVRKIAPDGTVDTIAGSGAVQQAGCPGPGGATCSARYSGDGGRGDVATMDCPHDVAIGPDGLLYIADIEQRARPAHQRRRDDRRPWPAAARRRRRARDRGLVCSPPAAWPSAPTARCTSPRRPAGPAAAAASAGSPPTARSARSRTPAHGLRWPWGIDTTPGRRRARRRPARQHASSRSTPPASV